MALCPARVHAVQHRAPVLRLGAACAGMEGHEGVVAVVFTGEQRAELLLCYGLLDRHLADGQQVVAQRAHPAIRLDLALERTHAGDDLLALLRVVPEAGLGGLDLELLDLALRLLDAERLVEAFDLRLEVVQFHLVFFKLQHINAPSSVFSAIL